MIAIVLQFIGCGTVNNEERHAVNVEEEITIQEALDATDSSINHKKIDESVISREQEELLSSESSVNQDSKALASGKGLEHTTSEGII